MDTRSHQFLLALQGMYAFLEHAYKGNQEFRWHETPYMEKALKSGNKESILGHMWSLMMMWYFLQRICPALRKAVDPIRVYELLLLHDVGETQSGDVSMYQKILGNDANKKKEREMIVKMCSDFPESSGMMNELVGTFDTFEAPVVKSDSLESLVANFIDTLQGGHFAIVYGNDLAHFSKPIEQILKAHFVPSVNGLIFLLKKKGLDEAREEVTQVVREHVFYIQKAGVEVDVQSLELKL